MTPTPDDPLQSPQDSDSETNLDVAKAQPSRLVKSSLSSIAGLPYRRSNASLSTLFQSTTSLPTAPGSSGGSGTVTPTAAPQNGYPFSPGGAGPARPASPALPGGNISGETKDLILRAFAPHVSVLASQDTEELIRHKGIHGGLLELLRPFGEHVQGKVTIRDSSGASRSWDDYAVRFTGVKDGLESPRMVDRRSMESAGDYTQNGTRRLSSLEFKPARLRSGGDVAQVEELVERHLTFAEEQSGPVEADYLTHKEDTMGGDPQSDSPFYMLYLRRLLSGMPMVPSETMSHPVATVIAISSRSPNPIEELRTLYASSNTGEHRLPPWVLNEFLRYYILIHDEDYDDISKSMALYDQMKRHFGLHCHLLRLRSSQCVPSDDDVIKLPQPEWMSAAEELAEIIRRETSDDEEDPTPCIFESDASALRSFVREMVTQSLIPSMERASAQWNDQVASRRRGISGRFMSLSKRFTTFGGRSSSGPSLGAVGSNYDSVQGHYKPDAPEAVMRRLADYSMMLRDFKLAQGTYEILCQDFKNDKAWRYYAGANEMAAVSTLLAAGGLSTKTRTETVDQYLETAYYSYITRVNAPYNALRTLILGTELLKLRGGGALDDSARWLGKIMDDHLVGPTGYAMVLERSALCYSERQPIAGLGTGERKRKAAFWHTLAADAWSKQDKNSQAESCLNEATRLYTAGGANVEFGNMHNFLASLQTTVKVNRAGPQHLDLTDDSNTLIEPMQQTEHFALHSPMGHRKSVSTHTARLPTVNPSFDPLGAIPAAYEGASADGTQAEGAGAGSSSPGLERRRTRDDGFE
jgi:hypothetical protein